MTLLRTVALSAAALLISTSTLFAQTATLAWNANTEPGLAGYIVQSGTQSGNPSNNIDVGNVTSRQFTGLVAGTRYYFRVIAYNTAGLRSAPSSEVSYLVPTATTTAPTVTAVSPNNGSTAGGKVITVTGRSFVSGATVRIGGVSATGVTFVSATQLRATTPPGTAGAKAVQVTNPNGQSGTVNSGFTYLTAPTLTSVSPNNGSTNGGKVITLTGRNFAAGATVRVGGVNATGVTFVSATQLRATTPRGTAGVKAVQVINANGQSSTLNNSFTYLVAPALTSVSPSSGSTAGGTVITLTGSNFQGGARVRVGGVNATAVTFLSATQLRATTPRGTAGAKAVQVINANGQSATRNSAFTYTTTSSTSQTELTSAESAQMDATTLSAMSVEATALSAPEAASLDAADDDADGLPTAWEQQFGLAADSAVGDDGAEGDPDGDGVFNADEYRRGTHPRGLVRRYLAEGAVSAAVDTRFAIANPAATPVSVVLSFFDDRGTATRLPVTVPARSRRTIDARSLPELNGKAFATELEADQVVALDRVMSWASTGTGVQIQAAADHPSTHWYLAPGSTQEYALFYLLHNPGDVAADVQVRYLGAEGLPAVTKAYSVAPHSRLTIPVNREDAALASTSVSAEVTSVNSMPIVAEQSMYVATGEQGLAHVAMGLDVDASDGTAIMAVQATSKGAGYTSDGESQLSVAEPAARWLLAEAEQESADGAASSIVVANMAALPTRVAVTLLFEDAPEQSVAFDVGAGQPLTVPIAQAFGAASGQRFSVLVESLETAAPGALVVERQLAGSSALAARLP